MPDNNVEVRPALVAAAQYVRMSTEHQRYSIDNQSAANAAYAAQHGYEIVRTYSDAGISGLRIEGRKGLQQLLAKVLAGNPGFSVILTYDVSRWGRFQDPDQAAHYEFICKDAGVGVEYCAEQFENDGSLNSTLVKHIKRAMAHEYSRELSVKVGAAQRRLAEIGFWQGGPPGYGLRRQIVKPDGSLGQLMGRGEWKAVVGDRVILAAGPEDETALVRRIYRMFIVDGLSRAALSRTLNSEGLLAEGGARWSPSRVHQVLTNEKYVGTLVFGKTGGTLQSPRARRAPAVWMRTADALPPIIAAATFAIVQRNIARRCRRMSDADMVVGLKRLLAIHGRISAALIKDAEDLPCPHVYRYRFGGLIEAFALAGYSPSSRALRAGEMTRRGQAARCRNWSSAMSDAEMIERLRRLLLQVGSLSHQIIDDAAGVPSGDLYRIRFGGMKRVYEMVGYTPTKKQLLAMGG